MRIEAGDKLGARERLLFAGFQLFLQKGMDGTGVDEVLKTAEVSRGGMYHHFASKTELYEAVLDRYFLRGFSEFDLATFNSLSFDSQKDVLCQSLNDMFGDIEARYDVDRARYFALFFDSLSRSPNFQRAIRSYYAKLTEALVATAPTESDALDFMRLVEGEIYLATVFGRTPNFDAIL